MRELLGALESSDCLPGGERHAARSRRRLRRSPLDGAADQQVQSARSAPASARARRGDEFSDFLSEVSATVAQQVDSWRTKVAAAILRWEGEGFSTRRLEALLQQEMTTDPEQVLHQFEADVRRLQALHAEAAELAPAWPAPVPSAIPIDIAGAEALIAAGPAGRASAAGAVALLATG